MKASGLLDLLLAAWVRTALVVFILSCVLWVAVAWLVTRLR